MTIVLRIIDIVFGMKIPHSNTKVECPTLLLPKRFIISDLTTYSKCPKEDSGLIALVAILPIPCYSLPIRTEMPAGKLTLCVLLTPPVSCIDIKDIGLVELIFVFVFKPLQIEVGSKRPILTNSNFTTNVWNK